MLAHASIEVHGLELLTRRHELLFQLLLEKYPLLSELTVRGDKFSVVFGILFRSELKSWWCENLLGVGIHLTVAGSEITILLASWKAAAHGGLRYRSSVWIIHSIAIGVLTVVRLKL